MTTLYQVITGIQWHQLAHAQSEQFIRSSGLYYHILTVRYYSFQALIGMLLYSSIVKKTDFKRKIFGLVFTLTILVVLFHSYSKAGYLALTIWVLVWTIYQKKYITLAAVALAALLAVPFFAADIAEDVQTVFHREISAIEGGEESKTALAGRVPGWKARLTQWSRLGVLSQAFGSGFVMTGAHNDFIMVLFHGGVVGLIIYLLLLWTIGIRLFNELRRRVEPLGVASMMFYLAFLIESMGLEPSSYPQFQWMVWGLIGLFLRRRQDERRTTAVQSS